MQHLQALPFGSKNSKNNLKNQEQQKTVSSKLTDFQISTLEQTLISKWISLKARLHASSSNRFAVMAEVLIHLESLESHACG